MKQVIALTLALAIGAITHFSSAQGQVYLFGNQIKNESAVKLPEVARLNLPSKTICLQTKNINRVSSKTILYNDKSRLQLSSVVDTESPRHITASITSGDVPAGTILKLVAMAPNEHFNGDPGEIKSGIILSKANKAILSDIKTCYSGRKEGDGYGLEYTYEIPANFPLKNRQYSDLTVAITLSAI